MFDSQRNPTLPGDFWGSTQPITFKAKALKFCYLTTHRLISKNAAREILAAWVQYVLPICEKIFKSIFPDPKSIPRKVGLTRLTFKTNSILTMSCKDISLHCRQSTPQA